jgi:signal transduction histidine kinase
LLHSIRWRLVLSYAFLILLTLGLAGVIVLRLVEGSVERQERESLAANAQAIAAQAQDLMWPAVHQSELQEIAQTFSFLGNVRVRILDADRQVVADSEAGQAPSSRAWLVLPEEWQAEAISDLVAPFLLQLPSGRQMAIPFSWEEYARSADRHRGDAGRALVMWRRGEWPSGFVLEVVKGPEQMRELSAAAADVPRSEQAITTPIGNADDPFGYVEMSGGPDYAAEALRTTRRAFLLAAVGALSLAVLIGLLVSRGLTAPLLELAGVAGRMSDGDLSTRAPVRGKDEIGQLAARFNDMAAQLEHSFGELAAERDALRRFIADASHELRTPLTALKSFNDLLQGAAADDPEARSEFLVESQTQIERLEWITANLLDLSRLDAGLIALEMAEHNVADLLEAVVPAYRTLAGERGIDFSVELPDPALTVHCDGGRLELALSNLLDNACKFTPAGGEVELGAAQSIAGVRFWVRDTGAGILPDDLPHIFERFYRGHNGTDRGNGLGLAIVQSIVQAHGGQITVASEPGDGARFTIELPHSQ